MGVTIGCDAAKSGKNTNLLVIMCVRLYHKIGLIDLTNRNRFKKLKGQKQGMKSVRGHCGMHLMLQIRSYYYGYTNVDLIEGCVGGCTHTRSAVAFVTLVYIKVILYILNYRIRICSILLKITVNMRQLWLSSPASGSCIPNLGRFLASNNLSKINNMEKYFCGPIYYPLLHLPYKS